MKNSRTDHLKTVLEATEAIYREAANRDFYGSAAVEMTFQDGVLQHVTTVKLSKKALKKYDRMRINERTARFFQKLRAIDGVTVTYQQGGTLIPSIKAIRDSSEIGATDAQGTALNRDTMTWAFWKPDLGTVTPEIGDRINTESGEHWEVVKGPNDRPYALEEVDCAIMTVFTQRVKENATTDT